MSKHDLSQNQRIVAAFDKQPVTMLMAARKADAERASVCRKVAELRRAGKIALIKFDLCKVSRHKAGFYTTNVKLFPAIQLRLL